MSSQCSKCAYYYARSAESAKVDPEAGEFGECRRYAPHATLFHHPPKTPLRDTHIETFWPTVLDVDWCGEFRVNVMPLRGHGLGH